MNRRYYDPATQAIRRPAPESTRGATIGKVTRQLRRAAERTLRAEADHQQRKAAHPPRRLGGI